MPNWEGIEDASLHASRVWLSRRVRDSASDNSSVAEKASSSKQKTNKNDSTSSNSSSSSQSSSYNSSTGWIPLRKCDCLALNENSSKPMFIESGRCTADPVSGKIFFNFLRGPERELTSAVWFVRLPKTSAAASANPSTAKVETGSTTNNKSSSSANKKDYVLVPISDQEDSDKIETLYKRAIAASSSLGKGVSSMLTADEVVTLKDDSTVQLVLQKTGDMLAIKRTPQHGWFVPQPQVLQRGYGEYTVEGEDDEAMLGPVKSLVFVVHGIGEAMFSREDVSMPSLTEQMHTLRMATQKRQVELWKSECHAAEKAGVPLPLPPNRIEFLPIEWFNRVHDSSTDLMKSLKAVSLQSIPALRAIANDIVFDVLLYLTPTFCEAVLECVTDQVNALYKGFQQVHKNFVENGGAVTFIGHSLGSVIVWDLLSVLKDSQEKSLGNFTGVAINGQVGYRTYTDQENANQAVNGCWGPSLPKKMKECISFTPANTIFIGSPIGMFLTLRGAHAVFDAMRQDAVDHAKKMAQEASVAAAQAVLAAAAGLPVPGSGTGTSSAKGAAATTAIAPSAAVAAKAAAIVVEVPMASPFELPSGALYNIFHPSDPVAYRIEPLLLAQGIDVTSLPPPIYLTAPGKDVRLHLKARQFGEDFTKTLTKHKSTWNALIETAVAFVTPDSPKKDATDKSLGQQQFKVGPLRFPLGGKSERVDYSFQPGVIDNEYISAVLAHSTATYFTNSDFQDFLIKLVDPPSPVPPPIEKVETI